MKKILYAIMFLASVTAFAQGPRRMVGDTIMGQTNPDTTYFYQWWTGPLGNDSSLFCDDFLWPLNNNTGSGRLRWYARYNYTEEPLDIIGVAIYVHAVDQFLRYHDSLEVQEYVVLLDATPDSLIMVAQAPYDVTDPHRYMYMEYNYPSALRCCEDYMRLRRYHEIYECFFDKQITVQDSFYVGATYRCWAEFNPNEHTSFGGGDIPRFQPYYGFLRRNFIQQNCDSVTCPDLPMQRYAYLDKIRTDVGYYEAPAFMLVFPILPRDTVFPACPKVGGLLTRGNYTDTVTVQWAHDSLHSEFELSYGREGTRPEDGTIVTVNDNHWLFTDTMYRDTPMVSYVRTVCREYDTLRWSEWNGPIRWRLHHETSDTTHHEGIEVADDGSNLSRFVQLMPNPTSGNVMVMSSYGIDRMEVYDVRGEKVLEQSGTERRTVAGFDVSSWAKGAYVVLVYTPSGTVAKRLVVQ